MLCPSQGQRSVKKHFILSQVHKKKNEQFLGAARRKRKGSEICASVHLLKKCFTGVISAALVNYSCVLIVWLELTKTTSSTERTHATQRRAYRQHLHKLPNN